MPMTAIVPAARPTHPQPGEHNRKHSKAVPLLGGVRGGFLNDAVRRCDTNGDGRITELEARIFAESADKHL